MTFAIHVKDGTNAGRTRKRPLPRWTHRCAPTDWQGIERSVHVTTSAYSCPVCGARRPEKR